MPVPHEPRESNQTLQGRWVIGQWLHVFVLLLHVSSGQHERVRSRTSLPCFPTLCHEIIVIFNVVIDIFIAFVIHVLISIVTEAVRITAGIYRNNSS
jgi:hypothetical protein